MEFTVGSVSVSASVNDTLACRWSAETAGGRISRVTSVSRVSVSGRRPSHSAERHSFVRSVKGALSSQWRNFSEDISGLGCRLCTKGQTRSRTSRNSKWQASAVAEYTGTGFKDLGGSARDNLSNSDSTVHIVKEGDTLTALAKRYNTTISTIAGDNGIDNIDFLQTGEMLVVQFPSAGVQKASSRKQSEKSVVKKVLSKSPSSGGEELSSATTSGLAIASTLSSACSTQSLLPAGTLAHVAIPLLMIAPVVGFFVRFLVDYIQERIRKEVTSKHAELETYHARHRPKVKRWQGILDEDREEVSNREAAFASDSLDEFQLRNEQQILTGYASIRAMSEESLANETGEDRSARQLQDYEDIRKSYAELESTYMKFLSDSGLSRAGYWRGAVTQLQEEV